MYVRPPQLIVICINPNFIPLRPAAAVVNICQSAATRKRSAADACYAVRDFHTRQARATIKRTAANARHAVRNCYARKAAAVVKCMIADTRYTVRDCYAL